MRQHGIAAEKKRKFIRTMDSNHSLPMAPNRLNQCFKSDRPNTTWTADITYIWTQQGWLYLAVVLDLFSRRIVGCSMAPSLEKTLIVDALQMAVTTRNPKKGLIYHSDRGSQYASYDYQTLIQENKLVASMSRRGNCYDTAPTESWFATLKRELVYRTNYTTHDEARQDIFEYIEVWYNSTTRWQRKHSAIGYKSPVADEKQWKKSTAKAA